MAQEKEHIALHIDDAGKERTGELRKELSGVKETLNGVQETLKNCQEVLDSSVSQDARRASEDLDAQWKNFQDMFDQMNKNMITNLASSLQQEGFGRLMRPSLSSTEEELTPEQKEEVLGYDFSLQKVASLIKSKKATKIVVMAGAGISCSAGIPDFRSAGGLYANLAKYNVPELPTPEDVFCIEYFHEDPMPFTVLAKDMMPGTYAPTPTHHFIKLLSDKGLLQRLYTQNIDTLELLAGIPEDKTVFAHGSFADVHCTNTDCLERMKLEEWRKSIEQQEPPRCNKCSEEALVKPDIVFFGEDLPERFSTLRRKDLGDADLLIIMGTSLYVSPFNGLVELVRNTTPRVLINNEAVGDNVGLAYAEKDNYRDVFLHGTCDEQITTLCEELGWGEELKELIERQKSKANNGWDQVVWAQSQLP